MIALRKSSSCSTPALAGAVLLSLAAALTALPQPASADIRPEMIGGEPVVEISAGWRHSCARVQSGSVYCWGFNFYGQLGDGTTTDSTTPVQVVGLTGTTQIVAGGGHSCALRNTGRVFCWGLNASGQLGDGTMVPFVSLGIDRATPVRVVGLTGVTQIAVSADHSCAVRATGRAFCWGNNGSGQLGDGTTDNRGAPVRVVGARATGVTQLGLAPEFSCLLQQSGRVACWGENYRNQLGDGTTESRLVPGPVSGLTAVTQIAVGDEHSCALRSSGRVFCWGSNEFGGLGDGTFEPRSIPVRVQNLTGATQVAAGSWDNTACAVRDTGRLFCWGGNSHGQLGTGNANPGASVVPVRVRNLSSVQQVSVGRDSFVCATRQNGEAWCWGWNDNGQLGDGTTTTRRTPVEVVD